MMSAEEFVRAWQAAANIDEVCAASGTKAANAYLRAARFRKLGIPLKRFGSWKQKSAAEVETLKKLAIELGGNGKP